MDKGTIAALESDRKIADLLLLKETPVLAGVITIVAQPFAQIHQRYPNHLPDWLPLLIAAIVSALLSLYYVNKIKKTPREESLFLIPLVMMILFSGSIGANNLVDAATRGSQRPEAIKEIDASGTFLRAQLKNVEQQLQIELERGRVFQKALNLQEPEKVSLESSSSSLNVAPYLEGLLRLFVSDALAQQTKPAEQESATKAPANRAPSMKTKSELLRQLEALDKQQQQLKTEQSQLTAHEIRAEKEYARPLWKSW